jgi:hypothetical protein
METMDQDLFEVLARRHTLTGDDVQKVLDTLQDTRNLLRTVWDNVQNNETVFEGHMDLETDTPLQLQGVPLVRLPR